MYNDIEFINGMTEFALNDRQLSQGFLDGAPYSYWDEDGNEYLPDKDNAHILHVVGSNDKIHIC